jgi:hypothetical protein
MVGFFFEEWLKGEQVRQEEQRKERKKTKELKKKNKIEKRNRRRNGKSKADTGRGSSLVSLVYHDMYMCMYMLCVCYVYGMCMTSIAFMPDCLGDILYCIVSYIYTYLYSIKYL